MGYRSLSGLRRHKVECDRHREGTGSEKHRRTQNVSFHNIALKFCSTTWHRDSDDTCGNDHTL